MGKGISIRAIGAPPHYTTKTITCPSCGATLQLTVSDVPEENIELGCPSCGATLPEKGVSVIAIGKIPDWLKKYAPWLVGIGVIGGGVIYAARKKKK